MAYIYNLTDTWNAAGTVFTAIKVNVTNTASASGSKLIDLQLGGTTLFNVDKNGSVGIGTSSPGSKLQVNAASTGTAFTVSSSGVGVQALGAYLGSGVAYWADSGALNGMGVSTASNYVNFLTNNTERMRIDSSGNVGIGTSSPSTRLDVASAAGSTTAYTALFRSTNTNGYSGLIGIGVAPATAGAYTAAAFAAENSNGTATDGGRLKFYTAAEDASHTLTERMRIDSSGNVGIGTSSPGSLLHLNKASGAADIRFSVAGTLYAQMYASSSDTNIYSVTATPLIFGTNNTERARIDGSGNLLIGTTTNGGFGLSVAVDTYGRSVINNTSYASGFSAEQFRYNGTTVGTIQINTTSTAYNTTSDYRLKTVDGPITNSGAYIDALNPVQGHWKADGSRFIGLIAHEVQEVSETRIATGVKDGEEMQAMDYSAPELIANLIAEIQSLRARVAQLEGI